MFPMNTTIDRSGRLVIPKALRDRVGITAGEVDVSVVGAALLLTPLSGGPVEEDESGRLVIPATGTPVDDRLVETLRRADQR